MNIDPDDAKKIAFWRTTARNARRRAVKYKKEGDSHAVMMALLVANDAEGLIHDLLDSYKRYAKTVRTASLRRATKRAKPKRKRARRRTARTGLRRRISRRRRVMSLPKTRLYHVVAINERTGRKDYLTATPDTHAACRTILRKQATHRDVRKQLEPAN